MEWQTDQLDVVVESADISPIGLSKFLSAHTSPCDRKGKMLLFHLQNECNRISVHESMSIECRRSNW